MIRKFLTAGVSAVALAGAAHAAVIVEQYDSPNAATNEITSARVLAAEASLATTASRTGLFGVRLTTAGTIPPGQNVFIRVNLTGGVWGATLTGTEVVQGATGAVVNEQNTTTVRYLITTDSGTTGASLPTGQTDSIGFSFPVLVNGCNVVNFTVVEFQTEVAQTPIENGNTPATIAATALGLLPITCLGAFNAGLRPDTHPAGYTSLNWGASPAFSDFVTTASDAANSAVLGTYALNVITSALLDLTAFTTAAYAQVSGFTTTVAFASAASPAVESCLATSTTTGFFSAASVSTTTTNCTIIGGSAATAGAAGSFVVTLDSTSPFAAVTPQAVTVSSSVLNLNTAAGLVATDPMGLTVSAATGLASGSPDVEDLVIAGAHFGPFDWVGDASLPTNNVFRVTGLTTSTLAPTQGRVLVQNSSTGVNGNFGFTVPSATVPVVNGEAIINATRLQQIVGSAYGRADITLVFGLGDGTTSGTGDIDVDRLMSSAAGSAVVSSYGDNANSSGVSPTGQTSAGVNTRDDQTNN